MWQNILSVLLLTTTQSKHCHTQIKLFHYTYVHSEMDMKTWWSKVYLVYSKDIFSKLRYGKLENYLRKIVSSIDCNNTPPPFPQYFYYLFFWKIQVTN